MCFFLSFYFIFLKMGIKPYVVSSRPLFLGVTALDNEEGNNIPL